MYEPERKQFLQALESIIGFPYRWGGESLDKGFDCSGTVRYCWLVAGFHMPTDRTAHSMCHDFWKGCHIEHDDAQPGDLFFYGQAPSSINHVMIVFRKWQTGQLILAGARGGNSITTTPRIAYQQWALVDVCSENYWQRNFQFAVNPFLKLDKEPATPDEIAAAMFSVEDSIKRAQADATIVRAAAPQDKKGFHIGKTPFLK